VENTLKCRSGKGEKGDAGDDLWTAIEEWKKTNPKLACEVDHLSREVTIMRGSACKR
jgi:cytochrome c556